MMKNKFILAVLAIAILGLLTSAPTFAQRDQDLQDQMDALKKGQEDIQRELALEKEIETLKAGQADIRKQLDEIKRLIQARPAAGAPAARPSGPAVADVVFDLGGNPVKGDSNAPLTLVEFTDYQCPYCSRFTSGTLPQITKEYVDTGKLRHALLDMPLESIHKLAFKAAEATHCAEEQGQFWEMHDRLFANQKALEPWSGHAEALGLDVSAFQSCLDSDKYADSVRRDMTLAQKAGATGTPSFVLARTDPNDETKVTGIVFLRGAQAFNAFKAAIDDALGDSK